MDNTLLPDIFVFLAKIRPEFGTPDMIFLGGSQSWDGGIHKTKNSDYDVLVMFPEIERPESYTFTSQDGQRVYDLILRDRESLFQDTFRATHDGKGTLLHLAVHGVSIYDPKDKSPQIKSALQKIYLNGPFIPHPEDVRAEIRYLNENFTSIDSRDSFLASVAALTNRIGRDALRYSGHWTSGGKIAGRFLKKEMPNFGISLQEAFNSAVIATDINPLHKVINLDLPELYKHFSASGKAVSKPSHPHLFDTNPSDLGEAMTSVRLNLDALAHHFKNTNLLALDAASTWSHTKIGNLVKPLTVERFWKKPEEYFFALGRAVAGIANTEAALKHDIPTDFPMTVRIKQLFEEISGFTIAFDTALKGDSSQLQLLAESTLAKINRDPLPYLYRPSAPHRLI